MLLHHAQWHARRAANRLGLAGVVGVGLLVFCAIFYFSALLPLQQELQEAKREAEQANMQKNTASKQLQPEDQLTVFYKKLPKASSLPTSLEKIYSAARAQSLELEAGQYRLLSDSGGKMARYDMTFPVKGDYLRIRKFLARVLAEMPHLSLDSIAFQRQKISDTMVEAEIKMTLYLREE